MSTGIPKNMITVRFDSTNLDVWAPQIRRAADLLGVGYLFDALFSVVAFLCARPASQTPLKCAWARTRR
jgi:hypothetical protein